ncbi:MAG: small subunit ribosomal protein S16 [Microgenomates group bacterium Gr01-1014_7]|nr:MAG: small subunit ribosomal protein S16 [Microgenomates group bacterium Gr01-1014_7]
MRIGTKKRPFYRVVAVDERAKRTGGYLELLGTYNPLTEPKDVRLKQDRIDYWTAQGAQPSEGYLRMIGKAPQRPPRKPKKEKKEESKVPEKSENSENQQVSKPEKEIAQPENSEPSESTETPTSSDKPSHSESSEPKKEK